MFNNYGPYVGKPFDDPTVMDWVCEIYDIFIDEYECSGTFMVNEFLKEIDPDRFNKLSRGDKSRIGYEFSCACSRGLFPDIESAGKKGSTNVYRFR